MRPLAALAFALAAACDGGTAGIPIDVALDIPIDDQGGRLLGDLEALQFRVSDGRDFVAAQLYRLEDGLPTQLVLPDVPTGNQVLFDLSGLARDAPVAYGRTCRLVVNEESSPIEARLYFARVGRFRAGPDPFEPERRGGLMFCDARGRAIVIGGATPMVELFDPREGAFAEGGQALPRANGAIAVRADGTAVVAGGLDPDTDELVGAVEEIDIGAQPPEEPVRVLGPASQEPAAKTGLALAALSDRGILLTGGRTASGEISDEVAILADGDDQFRSIGSLEKRRSGHTATVGLGGVVYLIGGLTPEQDTARDAASGSIELFRPQDESVRTLSARLAVPRFGHTATVLLDGRILIVGGKVPGSVDCRSRAADGCFEAVSAVEVFDPIAGEVRPVADDIPGGIYDHTATMVAGGRVLIAGGFDGDGNPRADARLFDPQVEAVVPTRELTGARAGHTAARLCDDTVLLVGGVSSGDTPLPSERYTPAPLDLP